MENHNHNESFSREDSIRIICDIIEEFYSKNHESDIGTYESKCPFPLERVHFIVEEIIYDDLKNLSLKDIEDIQMVFNTDMYNFFSDKLTTEGLKMLHLTDDDTNRLVNDLNKIAVTVNNHLHSSQNYSKNSAQDLHDTLYGKKNKTSIYYAANNESIVEKQGIFYLKNNSNSKTEFLGEECIDIYKLGNSKIMIFMKEEHLKLSEEEKNKLLGMYTESFDEFKSQVEEYFGFKNLGVGFINEIESSSPRFRDKDEDSMESKEDIFLDNYYFNSYPILLINEENDLQKVDVVHDIELKPSLKNYFGKKTLVFPISKHGKKQYILINGKNTDYFDRE